MGPPLPLACEQIIALLYFPPARIHYPAILTSLVVAKLSYIPISLIDSTQLSSL